MKELFIYGASGHGKVVADIAKALGYENINFIDDGENEHISFDEFVLLKRKVPVALGIGDNKIRSEIYKRLIDNGFNVVTLIHPKAIVSQSAKIGIGTVVMPGGIINTETKIEEGVIVNSGSILEHECKIGQFAHISPNVSLAGNVIVGSFSHIGIGATVIQNITIGKNCIIGAGAVVVNDIKDSKKVVGIPAKEINVLITSAGRRVSLVKSFQETLKKFFNGGKTYTCDMNPYLSSACQLSDGFLKVPKVTDKEYLSILKNFCIENDVSIVVPTIDTELHILASVKDEFLKEGILVAVSNVKLCETFYLKSSTEKFFKRYGFDTPRVIKDISKCDYPIFAKLNNSSCSIGAMKVYTPEEAKILSKDKNYIFQEFIDGEEYTVDVFVDSKGKVISIVPRLRIEVRAGEVSKAKTVKDKKIIEEVKRLCSCLDGAYGCLTIQLFKTDKRIVFIEINPRFGGGYPLSYLSGANFAKYLIEDFVGKDLKYNEEWRSGNIMLRYDAEVIIEEKYG